MNKTVTARAHSNIAFIKYWGNQDHKLRIPHNPSISMNLSALYTETAVRWDESLNTDTLTINGKNADINAVKRIQLYMDTIRENYQIKPHAKIESTNNFPMGAGIASSASAFAALALAATTAADLQLSENELSALARLGSGSASRSVPNGFAIWHPGTSHNTSYAESIAPKDHWALMDIVAIVSAEHKQTGSTKGHGLAETSDLQAGRLLNVNRRAEQCRRAIETKDFSALAEVVELDSNLMHAVMMTSQPPLLYWEPTSLEIMKQVTEWRRDGLSVCYTMDAGPNVHCICTEEDAEEVKHRLLNIKGVQLIRESAPGPGAQVVRIV